jgi:hypothetical protein
VQTAPPPCHTCCSFATKSQARNRPTALQLHPNSTIPARANPTTTKAIVLLSTCKNATTSTRLSKEKDIHQSQQKIKNQAVVDPHFLNHGHSRHHNGANAAPSQTLDMVGVARCSSNGSYPVIDSLGCGCTYVPTDLTPGFIALMIPSARGRFIFKYQYQLWKDVAFAFTISSETVADPANECFSSSHKGSRLYADAHYLGRWWLFETTCLTSTCPRSPLY